MISNRCLLTMMGQILKAGGNAFDAALAVQFALNVVQPQSTGIGGGMFFLSHTADGEVFMMDGREEAPEDFHAAQFCKNPECVGFVVIYLLFQSSCCDGFCCFCLPLPSSFFFCFMEKF